MQYIEKKSVAELNPITGSVVDTWNVKDKVKNAPSMRIIEEALANIEGGGGSVDLTAIREQLDTNTTNISNLTTNVENYKDAVGLGESTMTRLNGVNINSINLNGFAYISNSNYGGTSINNGYLIQLIHSSTYKIQIFSVAGSVSKLQWRKCLNGTWGDWQSIPLASEVTTATSTANTAKSTADSALSKANTNATNFNNFKKIIVNGTAMRNGSTEEFCHVFEKNGMCHAYVEVRNTIASGETKIIAQIASKPGAGALKVMCLMRNDSSNFVSGSCVINDNGEIQVTNVSNTSMTHVTVMGSFWVS